MQEHMEVEGAGHYGIFAGRRWRETVYPKVKAFILGYQKASRVVVASTQQAKVVAAAHPAPTQSALARVTVPKASKAVPTKTVKIKAKPVVVAVEAVKVTAKATEKKTEVITKPVVAPAATAQALVPQAATKPDRKSVTPRKK
jgi:poly(3-hydroxybutyrate) depolymerase